MALVAVGVIAVTAAPASAAVTARSGAAGALTLAQTMAAPGTSITGASFVTVPNITTANAPNGTSDVQIGSTTANRFPAAPGAFSILTTGQANAVTVPTTADDTTAINTAVSPATGRGTSPRDTTVLRVNLTAPAGVNCLSFDFKFLSEEYPRYVGQEFNDAFIAELDTTTWTASTTITAPNNFAKDATGDVVSVNSTGLGGLNVANGGGTRFAKVGTSANTDDGGATGLLRANVQVTPGAHSLYLSIFDQGDANYDSAVFLNNLQTSFRPNPAVNCKAGSVPVNTTMTLTPASNTSPVGEQHTVTATLKDANGAAITNSQISFNVTGANTGVGTATTNGSGVATYTYTGNNPGTDQVSACFQPTGTCLATASVVQTWNADAVVTANPQTKVFGAPDPSFSYAVTGLPTGQSLVTEPTCTVPGAHTAVGTYAIVCSGAGAGANRDVTYVNGTLSVTPADVVVTADNQHKTYGEADPDFTSTASGTGLDAPATCSVAIPHQNAGTYPITCQGAVADGNHTVSYQDGTLTVTKATVTITADSKGKAYGDADPSYTYEVDGLVNGDALTTDPTCAISGPHQNAGTYDIVCSGAAAGGNYDIAYVKGTLTIAKGHLVITADPQSKVYGTTDPAFTSTVAGLVPGDSLTTPAGCHVTGAHSNVGTYPIVCDGATASGNYDISYENGTLQVTKADVYVSADNKSKTYGTADPTFSYEVTGLVGSDHLLTQPTCTVTGPHTNVGSYPVACSGADAGGNYTVHYLGGTLEVTKATATVIADDKSIGYGEPDPAFTYTVAGLVGGDALTTPATCAVAGAHAHAGSYPITCSGGSAGPNYDLAYQGAELTVDKLTVRIYADPATKVYGSPDPAFTATVLGLQPGDSLVTEPTCAPTGAHAHVGVHPIDCSGAVATADYDIDYTQGSLTVTPKTLTITAENKTKTFGDPDPAFTYQVNGLVGGDQLATTPDCGPRVDHAAVGNYLIVCTDADAGDDYEISYVAGDLRVNPAAVVVTADNKSITYGDADPTFSYDVSGLTGGDHLLLAPICSVTGAHTNVGTYPIVCSGADAGSNYDVSYQAGELTVSAKAITVTADSKSIVYGDDEPAFTSVVSGLVGSDQLGTPAICDVTGAHAAVGSYPIVCSGADAGGNYTISYVNGLLNVTAKAGVVTADNQTITYGDADPAFDYTVSGIKTGDDAPTGVTCTVAGAHSNVGTYPIVCSGGSAGGNYELSYAAGTLTVTQATVTVTADNKSKVFGSADPAFSKVVTGLVGSDSLVAGGSCTVTGAHSNVGTYPIVCSGADAGPNYKVVYVDGNLEVTKAAVTITADNKTTVYGAAEPAYTSSTSGLLGGDTLSTPATCAVSGPHGNVGGYPIVCSGADAGGNYAISYQNGQLTVTKAVLTVKADDKTKVQGNPLPTLTAATTGYVNGDGAGAVTGSPALSTTATATSGAGTYPITAGPGSLAAANYSFAFVNGVLTVTSQPPTASITTPPNGAVYFQGQVVKANYSCADADGTVVSCIGPVASGASIDTATTGTKAFVVTATDNNGLTGSASTSYKVVPVTGACRGTALSVIGIALGNANPATTPCATAKDEVLNANVLIAPGIPLLGIPAQGVIASAVTGSTTSAPGSAKGQAGIASVTVTVAGLTIKATGLTSSASSQLANCSSPATLISSSNLASLTVNGVPLIPAGGTSAPLTIPLLVGTIAINEKQVSGNKVTQSALRINVLGLEIALGQAVAGASCAS